MTQIFTHHDPTVVGLYQTIVADAGIPCFVRDAETADALAGLPLPTHLPSLCVNQDEDAARAIESIREYQRGVADNTGLNGPDWLCPVCGESVPATFSACWKCQTPRPVVA